MLRLEDLAQLADQYRTALQASVRPISLRGRTLDFNSRAGIMGVINLSPGSWYRESVCLSGDQAIQRARVLHAQGADLIDLGAESTLSHTERVTDQEQCRRLLPILEQLSSEEIPVSVETYAPKVASAALKAGAAAINFTGGTTAEAIYRVAAEYQVTVIICHVQGANVREANDLKLGSDPLPDLRAYFEAQLNTATSCGVSSIILDPGLGFYYRNLRDSSSRVQFQLRCLINTFRLRSLGYPVCHALPHAFEYFGEEVRCAEPFFAVMAALGKTDLFRTHEVARIKAVLDTLNAW